MIYTECPRASKPHNSGDYSDCPAVHAEMNAIISAARRDMIRATPELKKIFANYSNKSQYRDGAKYEYTSGARDDSDTFNFYIPDASWTSMNKELYAAFGSGKSTYGGSAYKYTVPSTDSTGDSEIELASGDRDKGCNLSIKKYY